MEFELLDVIVFVAYALLIIGVGLWVSRGKGDTSEDYFLASKSLPWWAIGSGFALGLAIASYEWMAAITLIVVGKFFLPIFIEKRRF